MKTRFPLLRWLGTPPGITSFLLVLITSVWLGFGLARVYIAPTAPTYAPDFGSAKWIAPVSAQAVAYYRKELYVKETVRHAWLMVTAPNDFIVFVNGQKMPGATDFALAAGVTGHQFPGLPTALLDLTPFLKYGINTIGIYVASSSYQNPPCLRARGSVIYSMEQDSFASDQSWRASSFPGVLNNLIQWTDPQLDDNHWPLAKVIDYDDHGLVQSLSLPPDLFQQPLLAHWICSFSKDPQVGMFSPEIDIPYGASDCWMQIASVGTQQIIINGHPIADSQEQLLVSDNKPKVSFYWIQPWIKPGRNQFVVRLSNTSKTPLLLAQISYRDSSGKLTHIISDRHWTVQALTGEIRPALELTSATDEGTALAMPPRQVSPGDYITSQRNYRFLWNTLLGLFFTLLLINIHWFTADYIARQTTLTSPQALALDASLHLPALLALLLLTLLANDAHANFSWANHAAPLWIILVIWFLLRWGIVASLRNYQAERETEFVGFPQWIKNQNFTGILIAITFVSFVLRAWGLNLFSLNQDEIYIRYCAHGIWERGYPSTFNGGSVQRMTTYEFLSYPIALAALFFGWSDWAVRVPALLFSTFTTWNLGRMGRELFSPKVGLLTAACYTFLPWNVFYARHCIHPAQAQFFALLSFWSFYNAIRTPGTVVKGEFYKACLFFILTYLTWEGAGLVLIAFFVMLLVFQAGRFEWLRQLHIYIGLFLVACVVIVQLGNRALKIPSYLKIGYGLSSLTPKMTFLDQTETPGYYLNGILEAQCHILLAISVIIGAFFIGQNKPLRYILLLFGTLLFLFSNLLPVYTSRYFYFYQDLLILGGCASLCYISDLINNMLSDTILLARRLAFWSGIAILTLVLLFSTTLGFRMVNTHTANFAEEDLATQYGSYWQDGSMACKYVADHWQPGDGVTGYYNYSYYYFTGHSVDFSLNENLEETSIFDLNKTPYGTFENIYIRVPSLLNDRDCVKAFSHFKRLWFIGDLKAAINSSTVSGMATYILNRSRIVYSGFQVNVYLADGMPTKAGEPMLDLGLPPTPKISTFDKDTP